MSQVLGRLPLQQGIHVHSRLESVGWLGQRTTSQSERGHSFKRPLLAFKPPQVEPRRVSFRSDAGSPLARYAHAGWHCTPIGATVVMPGDPRIGGRLCWQCGGRGVTPFLIFDEERRAILVGALGD